ncbi:MAG TPA: energy transducer TonB [Vicinamibacterales bacterium]
MKVVAPSRPLHPFLLWLLVALTMLLASVPRVYGQDLLASARALYQSAAYDEALSTLQQLSTVRSTLSPTDVREIEEYRFLCLLALGRAAEARESIAAVVNSDPLYRLDESTASPRVVAAFQDVRRDLLPALATQIYNEAKSAYDRKDFKAAAIGFETVMSLVEDPDMQGRQADLATLAKGFLDLSAAAIRTEEAAAAAPAPPEPAPAPAPEPEPTVARAAVIKPPVTIRQNVPPVPTNVMRMGPLRPGMLELIIDERGEVESARFITTIHPIYDALVLTAAKGWRYEPATADGKPIKFRKTLRVAVQAPQ